MYIYKQKPKWHNGWFRENHCHIKFTLAGSDACNLVHLSLTSWPSQYYTYLAVKVTPWNSKICSIHGVKYIEVALVILSTCCSGHFIAGPQPMLIARSCVFRSLDPRSKADLNSRVPVYSCHFIPGPKLTLIARSCVFRLLFLRSQADLNSKVLCIHVTLSQVQSRP